MPTLKLTARTVQAAKPPASGRLELFDEDLPGFCIRVTANGRRTACVFYRVGPRLRRATLGTLPRLMAGPLIADTGGILRAIAKPPNGALDVARSSNARYPPPGATRV